MRKEDLVNAIGEVRDEYILEAEPKIIHKSIWKTVLPIAASVLLLAVAGIFAVSIFIRGSKGGAMDTAVPMEETWAMNPGGKADFSPEAYEEETDSGFEEDEAYADGEDMTMAAEQAEVLSPYDMTSLELVRAFLRDDGDDLESLHKKADPDSGEIWKEYDVIIEESVYLTRLSVLEDRMDALEAVLEELENGDGLDSGKIDFLKYLELKWGGKEID